MEWSIPSLLLRVLTLSAFLNEVRAQAGKKLTEAQAQQLTAAANAIRAQIGC